MEVGCWSFENPQFETLNSYATINEVDLLATHYNLNHINQPDINFNTWNPDHNRIVKQEDHSVPIFNTCSSNIAQPETMKMESAEVFDAARCMAVAQSNSQLTPLSPTLDYGNLSFRRRSVSIDSEPGFELYHDLIMQHLVKDIKVTCNRLSIPSDPRVWSVENTQRWLLNVANQYQLTDVPFDQLSVPGNSLCLMGLDSLKQSFPQGGELVHAQLNVWVTANDYEQRQELLQSPFSSKFAREGTAFSFPTLPTLQTQQYPSVITQQQPKSPTKRNKTVNMTIAIASPTHVESCLNSPNSDSGISTDYDDLSGSETPSNVDGCKGHMFKSNIHLWQFLRELLDNEAKYAHCIRWLDRAEGIFKIEDSIKLSKMWGCRKHRPAMNYDKLSRSLRQYYRKGILKKTSRSQRLVYQFLSPYNTC